VRLSQTSGLSGTQVKVCFFSGSCTGVDGGSRYLAIQTKHGHRKAVMGLMKDDINCVIFVGH